MAIDQDTPQPDPADLVNVDKLPPALRMLCRVLGNKAAFELCRQRGGVPMAVPKSLTPDHWLVGVIGLDKAMALVAELGGEPIDVPKYDKVAMQHRHQRVHALLKAGTGPTRAALATGYTKRQILNIQADLAEAEGRAYVQPDLFGECDTDDADVVAAAADVEPDRTPVTEIDDEHRQAALSAQVSAHNPFGMFKAPR